MTLTPSEASAEANPHLTLKGPVAELWLNAPSRKNALPLTAWRAIPEKLRTLEADPAIRVCVVRGAGGKSFCAGADISEFEAIRSTPEAAKHYDDINVAAFKALKALPMPVIAAIEGPCLGGGLGLALACDIRIATQSAFFAIPAARLGLAYPPEALGDLLEAVSPSEAKKLLFTADRLTADEALRIGLINEIVSEAGLDDRLDGLCTSLGANAPLSLRAAKRAVSALATPKADTVLEPLRQDAETCIESEDYKEGCRAFLEKRTPRFNGR